jgi:hypothetical protein
MHHGICQAQETSGPFAACRAAASSVASSSLYQRNASSVSATGT